ncbi:MAG: hypothetical protein E7Z92_05845 [Cyanobacteria bacterium SIG31]|nr:hypothetical protein [Cyanobacteria bacterium SIG31]
MISINTNLSSLITQRSLTKSTDALNLAIERMTTGFKINHAKDNAANYSISTNLTTKISSYMVAEENASMGLDMLYSANGSLDQITDKLERLRALATQASNGTYGSQSLQAINSEASALVDEINRLYSTAEYNGINLFQGVNGAEATPAVAAFAAPRAVTVDPNKQVAAIKAAGETFQEGETYYICNSDDLVALSEMVNDDGADTTNVTFELTSDINMDGIEFYGIGNEVDGLPFSGVFKGNSHTISNLESYYGLFYETDGATIDSVILKDVTIAYFDDDCGGLIDFATDTTIKNCAVVEGSVHGDSTNAGGLVGWMQGGSISNSYSTASVESTGSYAGGLVGYAENVEITNSYATGSVVSYAGAGGLVGSMDGGSISNSYSTASVDATYDSQGGYAGGLVCYANNLEITNCYATGYVAGDTAGGLVSSSDNVIITNSYATGNVDGTNGSSAIGGGLIANAFDTTVTNCYATGNVSGEDICGGLIAGVSNGVTITNCYTTSNVESISSTPGSLIGSANGDLSGTGNYYNSETGLDAIYSDNSVSNTMTCEAKTLAELQSPALLESMGYTRDAGWRIENGVPVLMVFDPPATGGTPAGAINFQIGIHSGESSRITLNLGFVLDGVNDLYGIGLDTTTDYLTKIDDLLSVVSNKATEYGAVQNRLESALDEIATQYENLVSTRSTIRDADIAEVSSQYIQQQILQQASTTLMATANQTPAIALQLI